MLFLKSKKWAGISERKKNIWEWCFGWWNIRWIRSRFTCITNSSTKVIHALRFFPYLSTPARMRVRNNWRNARTILDLRRNNPNSQTPSIFISLEKWFPSQILCELKKRVKFLYWRIWQPLEYYVRKLLIGIKFNWRRFSKNRLLPFNRRYYLTPSIRDNRLYASPKIFIDRFHAHSQVVRFRPVFRTFLQQWQALWYSRGFRWHIPPRQEILHKLLRVML